MLLEYAKKEKIDLITVGTRGRSGLKLLLGSVASEVVKYAHGNKVKQNTFNRWYGMP